MKIQNMFVDDINRNINGVVKVTQDDNEFLSQELKEYVVTKELKKHFITFFTNYSKSFDVPTSEIGVWISGFFGSGKSHFLKILSYILDNENVTGEPTLEIFRKKFEGDSGTFSLIEKSVQHKTETILFNIDIAGSITKDKTAVLRVFAKVFYDHLGCYGDDLKVAKLEQLIAKQGKTEEFRRVFEEKNGESWVSTRSSFAFFEDDVVATLTEVLGMSETAAHHWFDGTETTEMSIEKLVSEIKEYVQTKDPNFRLLFMVDEVGQYIGADTDLLLNLQSIIEEIGSKCGEHVWVVCTGQEAIDEIIKTRQNEFSRIQARFNTRLSLSSSAVDEVIQKRILSKTPEATEMLTAVYDKNEAVLRNLFSFSESVLDIKGYSSANEFVVDYPFVPYQFIIMQKVFSEVRKHGNAGKHFSGAERSMLSGFKEAVQQIQNENEYTLIPLFRFYDTVHSFLDGSIRRVIERCERAAEDKLGVEAYDVEVLKLLYLIRYIDDIKSSIDNIAILMADKIDVDKVTLREKVTESLGRLEGQNYIGRTGDTYNFLTDEEQDIAREIKNTIVDTATVVSRIGDIIFGDIYSSKKYRFGKYDFSFNQMVDNTTVGSTIGSMTLQFLTVASDPGVIQDLYLMTASKGRAIIVLAETSYFDLLENAAKITKYKKQRNVTQLAKSVQDIIQAQSEEARNYELQAKAKLEEAILNGAFYVDGEKVAVKGASSENKINQALEYLVSHVYSDLALITKNVETDEDIKQILLGTTPQFEGTEDNIEAAAKVEEYLEMQQQKHMPTSMDDIQSRYQAVPYGWREIDIAAVVALLINQQKLTLKYSGETVQPNNPKLVDMLRKKSERGKVSVSKRQSISASNIKRIRGILRDYFEISAIPSDEDGLIVFITEEINRQKTHYEQLLEKYAGHKYPEKNKVQEAITLLDGILSQQKDNIALVTRVLDKETELLDSKDDLQNVEDFFKNQVSIFDAAVKLETDMRNDLTYLENLEEANQALNQIRLITMNDTKAVYRRIPELNDLMECVRTGHNALLEKKRESLYEIVRQCLESIHTIADTENIQKEIVSKADSYYVDAKERISKQQSLALLDGMTSGLWDVRDQFERKINVITKPQPDKVNKPEGQKIVKKNIKAVHRQIVFPASVLENKNDIDAYVELIRKSLEMQLDDCDGIQIK